MRAIRLITGILFFIFYVMSALVVGAGIKDKLGDNLASIEKETKIALTELDKLQASKYKNPVKLDTATTNIKEQIHSLRNIIQDAESDYGTSINELKTGSESILKYLQIFESARKRGDWSRAKLEFQNIRRSVKAMHSTVLKLPSNKTLVRRNKLKPDSTRAVPLSKAKTAEPRRITLSSGNNLYVSSTKPFDNKDALEGTNQKAPTISVRPLSAAQISEAIKSIQRTYDVVPYNDEGPTTTPLITMSPTQTRGIRAGSLSNYDYYELHNGSHFPYTIFQTFNGEVEERNVDIITCDDSSSSLMFRMEQLDNQKLYLADITISNPLVRGTQYKIGNDILLSTNGHILYAFRRDSLFMQRSFSLKCLGPGSASFKKIEVYEVN